jgi:hypothetical protein
MDSSDFIRLLKTDHYSPADLEEIRDICKNYPMFNLAHMLKVRAMEALGQEKEEELKVAAIYASDRKKLHQLVTEVTLPEVPEEEEYSEETTGIQFSDEPHQEAEVIIEQHAPYAVAAKEGDLLELDDEGPRDAFIIDEDENNGDPDEDLTSETLIQAVVKEETDMEEPDPEGLETPVIDEVKPENRDPDNHSLIRNFIEDDPGPIRADNPTLLKGDVSLASIREHDGFITDTLAKIYVKQGLYAKAIYAYEKLSLKYPEKSAYFAAQIEKIKSIKRS